MAFSFRQIRYFVATAETGSVSVAARQLSISQSSISKAIQDLEHDLGFKLLERASHGMTLTLKGQQFFRHAQKILSEVASARTAFSGAATKLEGELRLGVTPIVSAYVLADILARFRRAFPLIDVTAVEETREHLGHILISGELDIAIMILPGDGMSAFNTEPVAISRYKVWIPIGHPLGRLDQVSFADLSTQPQILLSGDEIDDVSDIIWRRRNVHPPIAFRTRSIEAVRSLVATGAGIAVLPDLAFRHWSLEGDKIEEREIEDGLPPVPVGLVWRRGSQLSEAAQSFVSMAHSGRGR
ncbi:LysR substrate-binding domain-containing protein [Chelatococcus sp. GCM10030263]|uniref:LysR substrate-binding domain-containing protein n=1 Tax=Chelatococcus sp. GCM10030263 TaxID=3273387 RepID=UPI003621BCCD